MTLNTTIGRVEKTTFRRWCGAFAVTMALVFSVGADQAFGAEKKDGKKKGALLEEVLPYKSDEDLPTRTPPIVEIGPKFLGRGEIDEGFEIFTGAVWQPALWVFGDYRTSINYVSDADSNDLLEWANSLDLFANLQLTPTERILLGINPLRNGGAATGHVWKPDATDGEQNHFNTRITTFFAEGQLGELFPTFDATKGGLLDYGFSIGRQLIFFQEGIMLNDTIDAVGINRDTIQYPGVIDTRFTVLFGWDEVGRDDNVEDEEAYLFGIFTETDFRKSTVNVDLAYVLSEDPDGGSGKGDGIYAGIAATQRIGHVNTSFRINGSWATGDSNEAVSDGYVLMAETSITPFGTHDVAYLNAFAGFDHYSSAARSATAGGPMGRVGILFASPNLGRIGSPLSNRADEVVGGALGYQMFFNGDRTQIIAELGARKAMESSGSDQFGIGARFQQAIGKRHVLQFDAFAAARENESDIIGGRAEWLVRF